MDVNAIRWETLAVVGGMLALAVWGFAAGPDEAVTLDEAQAGELAIRVEVRRAGMPPQVLTVPDGCLVGRSRECHIILDDGTVSKQHARLSLHETRPFVEDLNSTNGTTINGKLIDQKTALRRGDRIGLGTNLIVLVGTTQPALNRQDM